MLKLIFFGTSEFAVPALEALIKGGLKPIALVTSPDKPAGRGKKIAVSPVKEFGEARIPNLFQPEKLDREFISKLAELKPDMGVVASYGKILPKTLIDIFPKGILNIHPSLLPKFRGASPIQSTILAGEKETGVTIILMDEKMDHGPVLARREFQIPDSRSEITYAKLHDSLAKIGAELLLETVPKCVSGDIVPVPQDDDKATFTKLIRKEDGLIDWSSESAEIERKIRAYNPWPGAWTEVKGSRLKIIAAEEIEKPESAAPGVFFEYNKFPAVACGKRGLLLLMVHPEGKKEMRGDAYLRGNTDIIGSDQAS